MFFDGLHAFPLDLQTTPLDPIETLPIGMAHRSATGAFIHIYPYAAEKLIFRWRFQHVLTSLKNIVIIEDHHNHPGWWIGPPL